MKKTILVSGASGIVGYGILRSLKKSREEYRLIGTTTHEFSVAPAFCDIFERAIPTTSPNYMDWLCGVIEKHAVQMIIPSIEADLYKWNEERQRIIASDAIPLLNNIELIELCKDKWIFYQHLLTHNENLAIPTVVEGDFSTIEGPFLLKPRRGFGSKGIVRINSEKEFEAHKDKLAAGYIMQPIIGTEDEEYTVSAFFNNSSELIDYFSLRRKLSGDGITTQAEVVDFAIEDILLSLAKSVKPIGPTNFQFRMDGDNPKLLEINPRISSATSIRSGFGYNESVMSIDYFLNGSTPQKVDKSSLIGKHAVRYMEDYFL